VSHANAALTPRARLRLARLIVDQEWPVARAAERYDVSWPTANRWALRYRELGAAGMVDRSSRPHRSPGRTPAPVVRKIVHLRWKQRLGPVAIGAKLGCRPPPCTPCWCAAGSTGSGTSTGSPANRSAATNNPHPGSLLHVDVKSWATCPTAAAGATWVGPRATATGTGTRPAHTPRSAPPSCTP
jgi:hypothetical protein